MGANGRIISEGQKGMNKIYRVSIRLASLALLFSVAIDAGAATPHEIVSELAEQAGRAPEAAAGERLWRRQGIRGRNCSTCHGEDLTSPGRHKSTGKTIAPMAPSVNPDRYTDRKKVAKWLKRNCKWTFGRHCMPGEKADLLQWLSTL